MAETLLPVTGVSYSANAFDDLFEGLLAGLLQSAPNTQGPLRYNPWGYNLLEVTGISSPVTVDSGAAWVKGKLYRNTASVNIAIPTPANSTRIDRIILRLVFGGPPETCTIVRLAGEEGGAAPALTQTDGVTWEVSLARVSITTGGAITVTDERIFVGQAGVVAAMIAANAVGNAAFRQSSPRSVVGRSASSTGNVADIVAGTDGFVLRRSGTTLAFGTIGANSIASGTDLQPKLVNVDKLDGLHAADIIADSIPLAAIILWSGSLGGSDGHRPISQGVANENWHLCNGELVGEVQTPDLCDRFIVGAGSTYAVGATGGATTASHTHGIGTIAAADHPELLHSIFSYTVDPGTTQSVAKGVPAHPAQAHSLSGTSAASAPSNLPPYYGVYYIMKVA